jgi:Na+/H+-dicarboxylate symporter
VAKIPQAVTLPISIETAVSSAKVSAVLANVILPMGANINMDGAAISFPCAITFMANAVGVAADINGFTWGNITLGSSLGSVGAAPVSSAGID